MCGLDISGGILKVHRYAYIKRCVFYGEVNIYELFDFRLHMCVHFIQNVKL